MSSFSGIAPRLPMHRDSESGIALTQTIIENTRQNLKMLLLTSPGERIMHADYGVGLRRMLFDPESFVIKTLQRRIREQLKTYIPYARIVSIAISTPSTGDLSSFIKRISLLPTASDISDYTLGLAIRFKIPNVPTDDWIIIATGSPSGMQPVFGYAHTTPEFHSTGYGSYGS